MFLRVYALHHSFHWARIGNSTLFLAHHPLTGQGKDKPDGKVGQSSLVLVILHVDSSLGPWEKQAKTLTRLLKNHKEHSFYY
jgi:hypothetical protein